MEITYSKLVLSDVTIDISEADHARLLDLMRDAFLRDVQYGSFRRTDPPTSIEGRIAAFCEKYSVQVDSSSERTKFFEAVLGLN